MKATIWSGYQVTTSGDLEMTDDNMAFRHSIYKTLAPQLGTALRAFQSSPSKFQVLQTVSPETLRPTPPEPPQDSPKTLFILDSSFNPPQIAHQTLAQSALHHNASAVYPGPHRLLLLFSTMNADKAPSAASFDQRLTLMTIFASDLLANLQSEASEYSIPTVDIGVTTAPYYTDKSAAISSADPKPYPSDPAHVHLLGFDTLTRFFAPKYYPNHSPPLTALNPYFDAGHQLRVTLRPDEAYGSVEEQRAFVKKLGGGEMEKDGGKREWAGQVLLVDPNPKAGVSSTKVRKAAKGGEWEVVSELCTGGVAEWVKTEGLYDDDDRGSKMA